MAVTVSFLGGNGQVQSLDLPAGIDLSAYFRSPQPIPLSALGQQAGTFLGSLSGQSFLGSPAGYQFASAAGSALGGLGGFEQSFTPPNPFSQAPRLLGQASASLGVPQALRGLGNLSENFSAGGVGGTLAGLPAVPATLANPAAGLGVIGLGEAPVGAQAATAGLAGTGGQLGTLLPGLGAAASLGTGIADLFQGNVERGAGSLGGLGLGAAIGSVVPGVGTLLGAALGGGAGGFLGGLFGGGGSFAKFPAKLAETQGNQAITLNQLSTELQQSRTREDVLNALANFRTDIEFGIRGAGGVGGFATNALPEAAFLANPSRIREFIPDLPGGLAHQPGGPISFGLDQLNSLRDAAVTLLGRLPSGPASIPRRQSQLEIGRLVEQARQAEEARTRQPIFGESAPPTFIGPELGGS